MKWSRRHITAIALVFSMMGLAGCAGDSSEGEEEAANDKTYTLRYASFAGPDIPQMQAIKWWADEVERRSEGRLKVEFFYQASLLKPEETLKGVGDGRADAGYIAASYNPAELPLTQVAGIPFVTSNPEAQNRAFEELYDESDSYQAEWANNGVVPFVFHPATENFIGTKKPLKTLDDLKGMQIRAFGYVADAMSAVGAVPVALAAPDIYEAVERGVVEGFSGFAIDSMVAFGLNEVAPYVTSSGLGNYILVASVINKDFLDSLPDDIQEVIADVGDEFTDKSMDLIAEAEVGVCDTLKSSGNDLTVLAEPEQAKWQDLIGDSIETKFVESAGDNGQEFLDSYLAAVEEFEAQSDYEPFVPRCLAQ